MNAVTEKIVATAMEMDPSISNEQRSMVMSVLKNGVAVMQARPPSRPPDAPGGSGGIPPAKPYLRREEAATYLGCSVRQVDQLKADGALPFHRLGRRLIIFKLQDLDALMKRHRVAVLRTID